MSKCVSRKPPPLVSGWLVNGPNAVEIETNPEFSVKPVASNYIDLAKLQALTT